MGRTLSHRAVDALLRQLEQEKRERLTKLGTEEREQLANAEAEKKRELDEVARKKKELEHKLKAEEESLRHLREEIVREHEEAQEEQRLFKLQQRIEEFRGNTSEALRERLRSEGFDERLVDVALRRRTLEAELERSGGLKATFAHQENPLERIMAGTPKLYDMTDRRVLDRLEGIRRTATERGYLAEHERALVDQVEYHAQRFQENDVYREKDERGYLTQATQTIEELKKQLGMDTDYKSNSLYDNKVLK